MQTYLKMVRIPKVWYINCLLCKNYVTSYSGGEKLCRLYKYLAIDRSKDMIQHEQSRVNVLLLTLKKRINV